MSERKVKLSGQDKLEMTGVFLRAPVVAIWIMLSSPVRRGNRSHRKYILGFLTRWLTENLKNHQLRALMGPSSEIYRKWCKKHRYPVVTDRLVEDGLLLWLGPKKNDKVVLWFHGGGYVLPTDPSIYSLWATVQGDAEKSGLGRPSFAVVDYTLIPDAHFPTQLRQAQHALQLVLDSGVHPSDITLIGDSAGANVILALLGHFLHPHPAVDPAPPLSSPLGGAYLCSPWGALDCQGGTFRTNAAKDMLSPDVLIGMGQGALHGVRAAERPYADFVTVPEGWWDGMDRVFERVLITSGGDELLAGTIADLAKTLERVHGRVETWVTPHGVHNEPLFDWGAVPLDRPGTGINTVVRWLKAGWAKKGSVQSIHDDLPSSKASTFS